VRDTIHNSWAPLGLGGGKKYNGNDKNVEELP